MNKVEVIPIVVGALGVLTNKIQKWFSKIGVEIRNELLQKTVLLGTARIFGKGTTNVVRSANCRTLGDLL